METEYGLIDSNPGNVALPPPHEPNLLIDNVGNFLTDNIGDFLIEDFN